jgi:SAM-dependent methyltransferase
MAAVVRDNRADFPCRLCGAEGLTPYFTLGRRGEFQYYRCPRCTLVNYDLRGGLDQTQYIEDTDPTDDTAKRNLDKDATWRFLTQRLPRPGALLDIGCGTGRLLYLAQRAGWSVEGLELSEEAAALARARLGVTVRSGDFLDPPAEPIRRFDLVTLRHVLEHLVDPVLALERIAARLVPGGHALLEFPNIEGADKRAKRWLVAHGWHARRYDETFVPGHCNEFCRTSFGYLLGVTGFELVRWETYSMKPIANLIYNHVPIGNKARALVRRRD